MLATQNDLATVDGLRRLLDALSDVDPGAPVEWHVNLYDGPLANEATGEALILGDAVEVIVSAPAAPTSPARDAQWATL